MQWQRFGGDRIAVLTGAGAAILGVVMLVGGIGLGVAVLSSPQPRSQAVTAFVFSVVGLVNLWYSLKVSRADPGAFVSSGAVTSALIVYLGVALRDFGEPFWAHGVYLLLLVAVWSRVTMRRSIAA